MKVKDCKDKKCPYLRRWYNEACMQYNGSFYCRKANNKDIAKIKTCPLDKEVANA